MPGLIQCVAAFVRRFRAIEGGDLAASLSFQAAFALFPGVLASIAVLGFLADPTRVTEQAYDLIDSIGGARLVDITREPVSQLAGGGGAGFAFIAGVLLAIWAASGYVTAMGRAWSRVHGRRDERRAWRRLLSRVGTTVALIGLVLAAGALLLASSPLASRIGALYGLPTEGLSLGITIPGLALLGGLGISLLFHAATPWAERKFWPSYGAWSALGIAIALSAILVGYLSAINSFQATYGALGSVIGFLLWLWAVNTALVAGLVIDRIRVERPARA